MTSINKAWSGYKERLQGDMWSVGPQAGVQGLIVASTAPQTKLQAGLDQSTLDGQRGSELPCFTRKH